MLYAKTISAADTLGPGGLTKQTVIDRIAIASSADGTLAITDGQKTLTYYVAVGFNGEICIGVPWLPGASLTITPSAPMTVIMEYTQK